MNQTATDFLYPLLRCRTTPLLSCSAGTMPNVRPSESFGWNRRLRRRYLALARPRKPRRRKRLCRCQSAPLRQPQTHQREHRIRSPSIYRHRHGWRCPPRCAPGLGCRAHADRDPLHVTRQVSGALARRWLRLCASGTDAQAARHRLRRRSRLHRLQPGTSHPRFPESQVRSRAPRHGRISLRFRLDSRRLPAR